MDDIVAIQDAQQPTPASCRQRAHADVPRTLSGVLVRVWHSNRAITLATLGFVVLSQFLGPLVGWQGTRGWFFGYTRMLLLPVIFSILAVPIVLFRCRLIAEAEMRHHGRSVTVQDAWRAGWQMARTTTLSPERILGALLVVLLLPSFAVTFSAWKASIPTMHPFRFDQLLMEVDRWLHGGRLPQDWLAPLIASEPVMRVGDFLYGPVWITATGLLPFVVACTRPSEWRSRFLLSFLVTWPLLGGVIAMLASSAGPCFYAWATGTSPDLSPYAHTLAPLEVADAKRKIIAIYSQNLLLQWNETDGGAVGRGISAFPSLHVAAATLFALAGWARKRWLGIAGTVFAVTTMIGSVALGWHYAVDGYAGAIGAAMIWWGVGRYVKSEKTAQISAAQHADVPMVP